MAQDIWRYIVHGKGIPSQHRGHQMLQKDDLNKLSLPNHWWYYLDKNGEGQAIDFPLKIKPVLGWTPAHYSVVNCNIEPAPRVPLEKLCITIVKKSCNIQNLSNN
jgi:hypothetical protein